MDWGTIRMMSTKDVINIIKNDGIGVMPTDTIYGLVGSAFSHKAVERIYRARKREGNKPFIVLIDSIEDLSRFGIKKDKRLDSFLKKVWPGPISVILPVKNKTFLYLHRGKNSLAFRLPKDKWLRNTLKKTGPLVAPSANPAGMPPAKNIKDAKKYFGDRTCPARTGGGGVDFYLDRGTKKGTPSILIEIKRY